MKILIKKMFFILLAITITLSAQIKNKNQTIKISAENIQSHLNFLASDLCEGRAPGTKGGTLAAKYIANEFSKIGLKPVFKDSSYLQYVPMHGSFPLPSSKLILYSESGKKTLKLNSDYLMFNSGQQTFTPLPLPLVFVGYGIIAPEYDYNDYQSVDVKGKIVVFLEGEPHSIRDDYFDGTNTTIYSYPSSKQRIALSRGAAGSILIPTDKNISWKERVQEFTFEDITLAYNVSNNLSILINNRLTESLFKSARYSFFDIIKMQSEGTMISFPLNIKLSFDGKFKQRDFVSPNIAGLVEGSDPELKNTCMIVTAHYDHLGIGPPVNGDSVYNGALDNAIGVSVMIEIARAFSRLPLKPKRSILFMAVTGEEKGLLGSTYYIDHPVFPLYKTVANLNIDGIALFRDFTSVVGIGSSYSSLADFLAQAVSPFGIEIQEIPPQFKANEEFNRSDQMTFALAGIPSILILEGLKNRHRSKMVVLNAFIDYMTKKYHTPFDDLNQKIDYQAAVRHAKLLFTFTNIIANSNEVPHWNSDSPFINARLRSIAEEK